MGGKSSQSTQTVSIPPQVLAQYQAVTARSNQIDQTPFQQYGGEFVSPLTSTQNAGIANTNAAAGQAQPYYGAATGYTLAGGQNVNAQQIGGQQIGQFMSPYLSDVVGSEAALLNQNNQQAMSGQLGNAIQQGAFGGDRAGIAAANLNQQQNLANSQIYSGLLNQGFNTALGAAQQQQGVNLSADQANRQALQQTGQSLAGLGAGAQTAALQGAQAQMAAGQVQQQTQQAQDTALYNQFQQQQSLPYQQLQQQANIAEGIGANSGSTTTGSSIISDRRAKHDVHEIGKTFDGQPIYSYKYNGDDTTQIGLMAQDVEKKHPGAVGLAGGFKNVDYAKATAGAARRGHFADGGGIDVPNTPTPSTDDNNEMGSSVPKWLQIAEAASQVGANIQNSGLGTFLARGGVTGNSEGGAVHSGHFGEGYAGGGLVGGYGESPFVGYDPTAAYQAMYGGLLSPHGTGVTGGAGINIPSSGGSGGTLNAPKLSMETPDPMKGASQIAGLANGIGQMGNAAHLWKYGNTPDASPKPASGSGKSDFSNVGVSALNDTPEAPISAPDMGAQNDALSDQLGDLSLSDGMKRGGLVAGRYHRDIGGSLPYSGASNGVDVPNDQSTAKLQTSQLKTPNMPDTGKEAGGVMKGVGSILDMIPGLQPIGMGLQAAGTVSSAFARGGDVGDGPDDNPDIDPMASIVSALNLHKKNLDEAPKGEEISSADDTPPPRQRAPAPPTGLMPPAAPPPMPPPGDSGDVADRIRRVEGLGHNPLSSAQGAFQMLRGTFINQFRKAFPQRAAGMSNDEIAALRNSPEASQLNESLGRHLVSEEGDYLRQKGLGADAGNVYLAHFMGPAGATTLLRANPSDPVANHVDPGVIKANPFLAHMSVGDVINWTRKKMQPVARASGGLVGRKGYADGYEVQDNPDASVGLYDPDATGAYGDGQGSESSDPMFDPSNTPVTLQGGNPVLTDEVQRGNPYLDLHTPAAGEGSAARPDVAGLLKRAGAPSKPLPSNDLPANMPLTGLRQDIPIDQYANNTAVQKSRLEGFNDSLGQTPAVSPYTVGEHANDVLGGIGKGIGAALKGPGQFIGGLGKGDPNSWLPLLAGVGGALSGPYRGIVGLGRGLAAGAETGQGMRQFGLAQQQAQSERINALSGVQRANADTMQAATMRMQAIAAYLQENRTKTALGMPGAAPPEQMQALQAEYDQLAQIAAGGRSGAPAAPTGTTTPAPAPKPAAQQSSPLPAGKTWQQVLANPPLDDPAQMLLLGSYLKQFPEYASVGSTWVSYGQNSLGQGQSFDAGHKVVNTQGALQAATQKDITTGLANMYVNNFTDMQEKAQSASRALPTIYQQEEHLDQLKPGVSGPAAGTALEFGRTINQMVTAFGGAPVFDEDKTGAMEAAQKNSRLLANSLVSSLHGRAGSQLFEQELQANPSIVNSPEGQRYVLASLRQSLEYDRAAASYLAQENGKPGFDPQTASAKFATQYPPRYWADRARADAKIRPATLQKFNDAGGVAAWNKPINPRNPGLTWGKALMNGTGVNNQRAVIDMLKDRSAQ